MQRMGRLGERGRGQSVRRPQHAAALAEIERLDGLVEGEPADPAPVEWLGAARVRHEKVRDADPLAFLLLLDRSEPVDQPCAYARLFTDLAQRGVGATLSIFDAALGEHPATLRPARLDQEIAQSCARQSEHDTAGVSDPALHAASIEQ